MKSHPLVLALSALAFLAPLAVSAALPAAGQDASVAQQQEPTAKSQVADLIKQFSKDPAKLTTAVAKLIAKQTSETVSAVVDAIAAAAAGAPPDVVSALATGLVQGAKSLAQTNPDASNKITERMKDVARSDKLTAFVSSFSRALGALTGDSSQLVANLPVYHAAPGNTLVSPN